ncbi:hypothetical protein LWI29_007925 [Acer saccharum]|uniref:Reverse transcriptase domain-containing protein n=1 Tax=Acer saccharum TaxID=4024 RepID=A0AA39VSN8_ACESA|nr:hypothetical protein LWI29_007925 [Acer saccharum]
MHKPDEEKTTFTTDQGLYCYTVMPFGLKNAGAIYQRLVNKMFARQIGKNMEKPEVSGRLTKWAIELSEFNIEYLPRTAIKGQAVADFVAEFTEPNMEVARMMVEQTKKIFRWQLRVDGSSNTHGSGAGVVVSTPEGDSVECA